MEYAKIVEKNMQMIYEATPGIKKSYKRTQESYMKPIVNLNLK